MPSQPQVQETPQVFQPFVPSTETRPELTARALVLGCIFGLLFGAVTVYVGLRAGLTVGASIPIAVLSISLLRAFGRASILENNIVQTTGNSGQSIASGVIFTLPALIFLGFDLEYSRIFLLALLAGERGGSFAGRVFLGLGLGGIYTLFQNENLFGAWPGTPDYQPQWLKGSAIRADVTPEYLGVGYIIGPRIAGLIFSGGVLSWLVIMPTIYFFGSHFPEAIYPGTKPIAQMSPSELWASYIRPMGAGAVAASGLITLIKTMPTIVGALRAALGNLRPGGGVKSAPLRTEDDLPFSVVVGGSLLLVLLIWVFLTFKPVPGAQVSWLANLAASLLVAFFGFLFVTVSSRIVGLIGSSSNPVSGMTIATLMATSAIFLVKGWTAPAFGALAITIAGVVCIAAANAGDTSQDLKTGFLIGATPRKQQIALVIGACVSTLAIGATLQLMNQGLAEFRQTAKPWDISVAHSGVQIEEQHFHQAQIRVIQGDKSVVTRPGSGYVLLNALNSPELADGKYLFNPRTQQIEVQWIQGIGSEKAAAPQARLMATVVNGILGRKLPWGLVLLGVFLVIAVELLGVRSLSFAVGAYLSIATTLAIFAGGIVRWMIDSAVEKAESESEISPGSLYASGLIAAGGIVGLIGVALKLYETATGKQDVLLFPANNFLHHDWVSVLMFVLLAGSLYYFARKPLKQ